MYMVLPLYAIEWKPVYRDGSICCYIDFDSIVKTKDYYFYNIKYNLDEDKEVVVTLQSGHNTPFSARLRVYPIDEYISLKGNYSHTTDNASKDLEVVMYGSVVYTAYKYLKKEIHDTNLNTLIVD